ncbi:MAG TPA: lysophospholipid acyltransferase family protein [Gaiellaceae bacterium]|nr:lysophospholipid acyltransferase family protein [Gaiellaceae bacterium]
MSVRERLARLRLAPDGRPRPDAPFGRGPLAARVLRGAIVCASATLGRLPAPVAHKLAWVGGTAEWALRPAKRRRLAENLCHTLGLPPEHPEVRALVRREVLNEARRSVDFLWAVARPSELLATTEVVGREHVEAALARGRGVLLVSTHVGGWEVAAALPKVVVPVPTTAIVTDDWLAWAVEGLRVRAGLGIMYDSDPPSKAARLLRNGEALLVLGDYAKPWMRTYPVRLLDAVAELPAGPVALARLCGSPLVPFVVVPTAPRRWRVEIEPALLPPDRNGGAEAERALLQELADRWSRSLRRYREHWAAVYPMTWRSA